MEVPTHGIRNCRKFIDNVWWELWGGTTYEGKLGINSWKIVVYARCAGSLQVGLLERKLHTTNCQTEGPTALGFWNIQDQLFTTFSNQRVSAKATSREVSQTCLLPDKAGYVTVLATFLQLSKNSFSWGGENVWGDGHFGGGGGKRMVENSVPWYCWHNWEGGGVNVWTKEGGGETYQILDPGNQIVVPSRTLNNLQPLLAQNYSVLPLGGCGEEPALLLRLAFGTGLLSDSNVRRIGNEGFSDWCCTAQETWKPLQPRTSERIPARKRKFRRGHPSPVFPPPFGSVWNVSDSLNVSKRMRLFYSQLRSFHLWFLFFAYGGGTVSKKDQTKFRDGGGGRKQKRPNPISGRGEL